MNLSQVINTGLDERVSSFALQKSMHTDFSKRVITIAGKPEYLDVIERMLGYISYLGKAGHSTSFTVGVDGDGSARITSMREGKDLHKIHKEKLNEDMQAHSDGDIRRFDLA